jgi:DNA invertase Pin-like site-specific DNA recombinase
MNKILPEHLARSAFVYVRQSTAYQVANNLESQRRQYGLVERARQLGWDDVQVVDDDLGKSGGGTTRPGFEKLLAAICEGRVGAVVSLEASRLARNGRDWHTLLEFCGLVGTLIVDEDAIFDPRSPNDRLLLGMKGTMSEMELSVFRQRSMERCAEARAELHSDRRGRLREDRGRRHREDRSAGSRWDLARLPKFANCKRSARCCFGSGRRMCLSRRLSRRGKQ